MKTQLKTFIVYMATKNYKAKLAPFAQLVMETA
jgi:hypothetical protein